MFAFKLALCTFEVFCKAKNKRLVICSLSHPFFPFNLICFLLRDVHQIGLLPSLALGLSHSIYGQPLDPMGIHLFCCAHGGNRTTSHDVVQDVFTSITRNASFHVAHQQTMFFCHLPSDPHINRSTLCFRLMAFACWPMLSLLTPLE